MELVRACRSLRNDVIALGCSRFLLTVEWAESGPGSGRGLVFVEVAAISVLEFCGGTF